MNIPRFCQRSAAVSALQPGFTLIELLVVISIIAILAGLLLPVVSKVMDNAKKVETKSTATQIVTAVKSYQTDYGQYPVPTSAPAGQDYTYTNAAGNANLFSVLMATDTAATSTNTRRIKYFEGRDAKSTTAPRSGFVPTGSGGNKGNKTNNNGQVSVGDLLDSWGNRYVIRLDSSYSDAVVNPYVTRDDTANATDDPANPPPTSTSLLRFGVVVWTYGKDGVMGSPTTLGDDVVTWQ